MLVKPRGCERRLRVGTGTLWPRASLKGLILIESGESSPNSARLTATRGGDTVADREKGGLKTRYAEKFIC